MSVEVIKTFSTTCYGDVHEAIAADVSIVPTLEQVIADAGPTTTFSFSVALSASEDTALDALLSGWSCPIAATDYSMNTETIAIAPPLVGDTITWDGTAWSASPAPAPIFGSEFQEASADGQSSTTSESYVQKLRLTTPSLPAGTYRIGYSYEWNLVYDDDDDFKGRVQINDSITIAEHRVKLDDSESNNYHDYSGCYYYTGSGVLNIDIDYARRKKGSAIIRRARLEIWRVS